MVIGAGTFSVEVPSADCSKGCHFLSFNSDGSTRMYPSDRFLCDLIALVVWCVVSGWFLMFFSFCYKTLNNYERWYRNAVNKKKWLKGKIWALKDVYIILLCTGSKAIQAWISVSLHHIIDFNKMVHYSIALNVRITFVWVSFSMELLFKGLTMVSSCKNH